MDSFTEKATDYLRNHDSQDGPFFIFLTFNGPFGHWPAIQGPARNRFADLYAQTLMESVPREGLNPKTIARFLMRQAESGGGLDYSSHLQIPNDLETLRNYFSQMSMVDDGVGQVLNTLDELELAEDTLVIYTCDHGFSMGHHGYWGHGQATWPANAHRAAYHVPLICRQPGQIESGQVASGIVSQIDLFATILDWSGLEPDPELPCASFADRLRGEPWEDRPIFIEQEELRAVRTRATLYVQYFAGSEAHDFENELYDLIRDPDERNNVAARPEYAETLRHFEDLLATQFSRHADPQYDLWQGGRLKSNSDKLVFWQTVWGPDWVPVF